MQPTMNHQMMGYDRSSTMFSPDGRLLQVEYAKKAVRQGTACVGVCCKDGVLLVADKRVIEKLVVPESIQKIFQVDNHIAAAPTGYLMDGRVLVERAQLIAQQHRITYDSEMDVLSLVKEIANLKQAYTQYGGARPFGVSILIAGIDEEGPQLFVTDVTGIYFRYKATAVGEFDVELKEILDASFKEDMSMDDALNMVINALKKVYAKDFDASKVDCAFVHVTKGFSLLDKSYMKKFVRK